MSQFKLVIVIPCFNEADRFKFKSYSSFLYNHKNVMLCFVNDGSTDKTLEVLYLLKKTHPNNTFLINHKTNIGKAEAVRLGVLSCLNTYNFDKIAYLDADLSTSLDECFSISKKISSSIKFVFGSRVAILDSNIDRKKYRFLIGRFIATLISKQLQLIVYDTQCGCKVFDKNIANEVFQDKFISRWLFDVEIFHRLIRIYGRKKLKKVVKEVPLKSWIDTNNSKVHLSYSFRLFYDLFSIWKKYSKKVDEKESFHTIVVSNENKQY